MKMRRVLILLAAAGALLSLFSCKSQYEMLLNSNDVDEKYEAAFDYYNKGKYSKAAALFESLSVLTTGMEKDDTVQYYWGLSNYRFRDYYTAETNFDHFLEYFPRSPFAPEARFLRLDCLYRSTLRYELDQTPTYKALNAISEYMQEYPNSVHAETCRLMQDDLEERLDTKAYESARLYYKMEDYLASRVAFRNVLKEDSENIFREDILYYIAMSSYKYAQLSVHQKQKERYMTFVDDYLNFKGEYPESPYCRELDLLYRRAQRALGRYVGEETVRMSRDLEKEIKKTGKDIKKEKKAAKKEKSADGE